MEELKLAIAGKSAANGGLNMPQFREALLKKYPHEAALINSYNRKELEAHYKTKLGAEEKPLEIAAVLSNYEFLKGHYFTFKYAGKTYKRWVPEEPILIEVSVGDITPPDKFEDSDDYPGQKEMSIIEQKIIETKTKIDPYDNDNAYRYVTDILEYYKHLKKILKEKYEVNYGTNAWLKMYEMLHYLGLVADNEETLRVFHNCELPGAFIQATLYYMKNFRPKRRYDWWGSSLVIHDKSDNKANALEDQYKLWAYNRNRWIMSMDDPEINGDTTKIPSIHHMVSTLKKGVDLYTSDAGISVGFGSSDTGLSYNDQEQLNMLINLGQILAMLETLAIGGNFITKQYTFFKPFTYSLMIIVASMFNRFYITKPLTSKPSNSEVYLNGMGFKGLTPEWKKYLEEKLASYKGVVPLPGPLLPAAEIKKHQEALDTIIKAAEEIYTMQGELVESNLEVFGDFKNRQRELEECVIDNRESLEKAWIEKYQIK